MSFLVRTPIFEGPIAVLYEMIDNRKLSISEFSLVSITDDFLNFVRSLDKEEKQEVAHFIAVAAVLIFLKSKSLLPENTLVEEEDRSADILENQLKAYGLIKSVQKDLRDIFGKSPLVFAKTLKPKSEITFLPDVQMNTGNFAEYLSVRIKELEPEVKQLKEVKVDKKIKIEDALNHVRIVIKKLRSINFSKIAQIDGIGDERLREQSKKTVVILFLSLLELVKMGEIDVVQEDTFGDMLILDTNYDDRT
jgi:segregation and condensation protein A